MLNDNFFLFSGLRIPCDELSIHRLGSDSQPAVKEVLDSLSDGMQFESYLAPEEIFSKIKELKEIGIVLARIFSIHVPKVRADFVILWHQLLWFTPLLKAISNFRKFFEGI